MKVLVIGSGGREYALAHTFHRFGHKVYCLPGNAGTQSFCEAPECPVDVEDFASLTKFCHDNGVSLTVCGPEVPLEKGIADAFLQEGLLFFGPNKKASQIESSKVWAKEFMGKYRLPTARYEVFTSAEHALRRVETLFREWGGVVLKPSGLTAGKGVVVCPTLAEARSAINELLVEKKYGDAAEEVIVEELLQGKEVSLMAFCDGKSAVRMIPAQDHKRLLDGGRGPNTGGVGAYTPTPFLDKQTLQEIDDTLLQATCTGLRQEGIEYCGFLYLGIMLTDSGPKMLEYNCRFGDPEAQVILPLLKTDLAQILTACCCKELDTASVEWSDEASCCVVMVSNGYPGSYQTGAVIEGLDQFENKDCLIAMHAGTALNKSGKVVASGGRVLGITAVAPTLDEAIAKAYEGVRKVHFSGSYYRSDIGSAAQIEAAV